jgi:DNA polymerase-3 subunit delta'
MAGHLEARRRLAQAVRTGRLPQVLLLTGAAGVGKQRLALWLAQLVLCEQPGTEPCGGCRACRLVAGLAHPDLHWFVPIPRPRVGEADKQVEEAAAALAQVMDERRANPLYGPPDGLASHGLASVRLLRRRAVLTPVEGKRKVFILGEADRLVPQESSPDAANALLKLLEEPPADSVFVLTTVDPRRLLPTIRSRAVPLRLRRLSDDEVAEVLRGRLRPAPSPEALRERVRAAEGSVGAALAAGDAEGAAYQAAAALLAAVLAGPGARMERALRQPPYAARGEFTAMLDALSATLGDAARMALGQPLPRPVPDALRARRDPDALLRAMERVADAREAAAGNVNPQLLLAVLSEELAEVL